MHRRDFFAGVALLAGFCTSAHGQQAGDVLDVRGGQIRVVTVATGLLHPWSIALLPGDRSMLVAERGRIRLIENGLPLGEKLKTSKMEGE